MLISENKEASNTRYTQKCDYRRCCRAKSARLHPASRGGTHEAGGAADE